MVNISSTDISTSMVVKLGEVCKIVNGFFFRKIKDVEAEINIPYIKSSDIRFKIISQVPASLSERQVKNKNINAIAKGALLVGLTGLGVGQIATLDIDAIIDPTVCAVVNNWFDALDTDYLYYFLLTSIPFLIHSTKTSTRVNSLLLRDLELNVLPIEQQKHIVKQIKQTVESFNTEVQVLEQRMTDLQIEKSNFLNREFENLQNTCAHPVAINTIAKIQAGNTPTESMKVYYGNEYVFFKPEDVKQATNMLHSRAQLSARGALVAKLIPANSLLLACAGPLTGKVGITLVMATCNKSMMAIIPSEQVLTKFLYYQFQTNTIQQQIKDNTIKNIIIKSKVEQLNCFIISLVQQQELVNAIDKYMFEFDKEIEVLQQQKEVIIKQKAFFLNNTFNKR